jgi:hypothetical protein
MATARDILLLKIDRTRILAVSCDAAGSIGSKPLDRIRADPRLVGRLTARVALMELLAIGADPIAISGTFCVEPKPTGDLLIEGIRQELRHAHLDNIPIACSSEKNFKVKQTGIGLTAMGFVRKSVLKIGRCVEGDDVIALGEPHVGHDVIYPERKQQIPDTLDVVKLRKNAYVHELIPVGSRGVLYETKVMTKNSGLYFETSDPQPIKLKKSAGPATVLLLAIREGHLNSIRSTIGRKPVRKIGTLLAFREEASQIQASRLFR